MPKATVLDVDDEPLMREYVEEALVRAGHEVLTASGGREAVEVLAGRDVDLIVTDLKMMPMDGLELLRRVKREDPDARCIVMTAYGTIETAVAALKEGAVDYILKPFAPDELELAVDRALEIARMTRENRYLRAQLSAGYDLKAMVGSSEPMRALQEQIQRIAGSRATVLVRGESGTGKELVAHAIHHAGPRHSQPFIKVNCAALSAGLLESELFGHEKGAFTGAHERKIGRFELADTGTLLLDEISEIAPDLQPKLLRALQEHEFERVGGTRPIRVDVRIVATSNRDLERAVENGKFREDLFFRLNVIQVVLPPLREHKQDILALMDHFLERYARENARSVTGFSPETRQTFLDYDWPGNVRELQNAIERAVVLAPGSVIEPEDIVLRGIRRASEDTGALRPGMTVAEAEKALILQTLGHCGQNRTHAAKLLGISIRTLRNKLHEYGHEDAHGQTTDRHGRDTLSNL